MPTGPKPAQILIPVPYKSPTAGMNLVHVGLILTDFFFFSSFPADIIFIMSMVTSFGNLVYYGLQFNERKTTSSVKWLLAFPMFAASVAARGFTLSVFLKETIQTGETIKSELIGALIVLTIYFAVNIALFR